MQRYLVTGGAGFIGSHIVDALIARGAVVRVLDNLETGHPRNLAAAAAAGGARLEFIQGDIRDVATCRRAAAGMDCVFHEAALGSVPRSLEDPITTHEVNATGTLNILMAAQAAGVQRLVFASSSSVYGDSPVLPKHEQLPPDPLSPYGVSKLAAESYCRAFAHAYGLSTICLRYFNVFGPRQDPLSQYAAVIPKFIAALQQGQRPVIYGDGQQSRDFTYVADVVQANLLAADSPAGVGQTFNVACGTHHSLLSLLDRLNTLLATQLVPEWAAPRPGDIKDSLAAIDAVRQVLGYTPQYSFAEGLRRTVAAAARPDPAGITRGDT